MVGPEVDGCGCVDGAVDCGAGGVLDGSKEGDGEGKTYARRTSFIRLIVVLKASSGIRSSRVPFLARSMSCCRWGESAVPLFVLPGISGRIEFVLKKQSRSELPRILVASIPVLISLYSAGVVLFVEVSL